MKKMNGKKIVSFLIVATFLLTLTACGQKKNNEPVNSGSNNNAENTNHAGSSNNGNTDSKPDDTSNEDTTKEEPGANLEGTITITGSTSVEKILLEMADEFMAYNPEVTIQYTGTGSSAGIEDAILGVNNLGASSREVKDTELEQGIEDIVFAYDGIALVTHPSNPVADLSLEQVLKIYSGEITNWNEVGGNDAPIIVISREGASGTRGAFEELIKLKDVGLTENSTIIEGNGNMQAAVAGNENAIGYVSFSFIDDTVKAFTIEGVTANADEVKAAKYPLSRPFLFVYQPDTLSDVTKAFLEYIITPEAQAAVENHGGIRID